MPTPGDQSARFPTEPKVGDFTPYADAHPSIAYCGSSRLLLVSRTAGTVSRPPVFCGSWNCRRCGPPRAKRHLTHLARALSGLNGSRVWWAEFPHDDRTLARLRQRRLRTAADALWVRRADTGTADTTIFASGDLSGRLEPTEGRWSRADVAYRAIRDGLAVPGVTKAWASRGWQPGPEAAGEWASLGTVPSQVAERALEEFERVHKFSPESQHSVSAQEVVDRLSPLVKRAREEMEVVTFLTYE